MSKSFVGPSGAAQQIPGAETLDELQPDVLRASQNDYNPPELLLASMLRLRATTALNLSGLAGTLRARVLKLQCSPQGSAITLLNESALSVAANRFALGGDLTLSPGTLVELFYDPSSARWRVVAAIPASGSSLTGPTVEATALLQADAAVIFGGQGANVLVLGNNNNWVPANDRMHQYLTPNAGGSAITGIALTNPALQIAGFELYLINADPAVDVTVANQAAGSLAANRVQCPGGANVTIIPQAAIHLRYETVPASQWRIL